MNAEFATELLKTLMFQAVALAAPILLTAMVLGLAISIFQSVTSIQEQTLTFVPKIIVLVLAMVVLGPWMLHTIVGFTAGLINSLPTTIQ